MTPETYVLDLTAKSNNVRIELPDGVDAISIHAKANGATWSSGVITLKKSNHPDMIPVTINGTPVTLTADGFTELAKADWIKAGFLVPEVTTAASGIIVTLAICLKRIGGGGPT